MFGVSWGRKEGVGRAYASDARLNTLGVVALKSVVSALVAAAMAVILSTSTQTFEYSVARLSVM